MGPRAGSHLYNQFHCAVEKELGGGFVDTDFPDSVLITVPAREEEPYSGRFGLDLSMLEMQLQQLSQHYRRVIVVPLCVTVSEAIKTVCEEYGVDAPDHPRFLYAAGSRTVRHCSALTRSRSRGNKTPCARMFPAVRSSVATISRMLLGPCRDS